MSLQLAAQHLADKGRGPDTTLVHMSNKEVKSLNDLAMAHGGHLTINPQTGLPEAGFLSAILPMVAGAALNAAMPGSGMLVPALVGGASMLLNPKAGLMGGLMAGLGAYGGQNLGQALAAQGVDAAASGAYGSASAGNITDAAAQKLGFGSVEEMAQVKAAEEAAKARALAQGSFTDRLGVMGQGVGSLTQPGGLSSLYNKLGDTTMSRIGTVAALASPALTTQTAQPPAPVVDKDMGQRYTFSPNPSVPQPAPDVPTYDQMLTQQGNFGRQQNYYPNQSYTPVSADQAKSIYGFAGGGPVEAMSNANAIGANTGFPQAYLHNNAYATPYQTPISQNVLMGAGDVSVDPYTGEQRMANGGVSYDPRTQRYTGGIADAYRPENRDVDIYNDTGGPASGGGPTSPSSTSSTGSPTGSTIGDIGYAISNQSISPVAAAIAQAAMDALSSTSPTSVNAISGLDAASDAAAAAAAASAATGGEGAPGMGGMDSAPSSASDGGTGGGGEARGGLSPRFTYHMAGGGISDAHYNLGGYSDGGRLLRGPGDGVSDSIPAVIGKKQPARLADGEFVVPARIVSELGNGSTEAGARKLYAMMDRIQAARKKTVGKNKVAHNSHSDKYLPA